MIVVGVDFSSFRFDAVVLRDDEPPIAFKRILQGDNKWERLRDAHTEAHWLYHDARQPVNGCWVEPDVIAVEYPAGLGDRNLLPFFGVLWAAMPKHPSALSLSADEWRKAIDTKRISRGKGAAKISGNTRVRELYPACAHWDEHELDALGICHATKMRQAK